MFKKSFFIVLIVSCIMSLQLHAAVVKGTSSGIIRMGSSDVTLFDNNWLFARYGLQANGTSVTEPSNLQLPETKDASWRKLDLPHDWGIEGPFRIELKGETGKLPYEGIGWYRKHFVLPKTDEGKKIFIDFDGAMAYAEVWLNGKYVGTWPYGYNSFRLELTPYLNFGKENVLAVRLNTEKWESRWYPGAGIYRHVWLVKTNPVHVAHWGTFITTPQVTKNSASVKLDLNIDNQSDMEQSAVVNTRIFELDSFDRPGRQVVSCEELSVKLQPGKTNSFKQKALIAQPKLWDLTDPQRYLAQTTISINGTVVDTYNTPFGVRTIEFTPRNGFLLNGKRLEIQGTCNHHDLGALGAAFNLSALKRQLNMLKEMGCNALRTSHNPPAPELLDLADKMGFLVWDEAFDCWKKGKRNWDYNKLYDEWHEKDLKAMVHRDRNHPSIFIWSIGNEVMEQRDLTITKHLVDIIRSEDLTRPVSNGYNDPNGGRESGACIAIDIMGVNYFFNQQARWDADPRYTNKPTIGSETSSCVSSRGEYFFDTDYKNWQITSYDKAKPGWGCTPDAQFAVNARFPHILGEFVWTGFDYLGEPTPYNSDKTNLLNFRNDPSKKAELEKQLQELEKKTPPSRSSYFGIIDLAGFPKDRYYLYQSHWRPDFPMAHILPHWNWPERKGLVTPVHVYTSGDEAELFLNGKSLGRRAKKPGIDFRLVWDSVVYEPGTLKVITYKNGKQWATDEMKTTGQETQLRLSADRTMIDADGSDLAFITVKVQDASGLTVPRTHPQIKFEIEGKGEIVATDNGDATDFTSFQSHERKAFNGMALVIVKAKKGVAGSFRVKAIADGLKSGEITLSINKK